MDNNALIRSGEARLVGWSRQKLYPGFNTLPRSGFWSANSIDRSDNLDVMSLKATATKLLKTKMKLRFTIRSLAIAMLLVAAPIGWWLNGVRSQQRIVAEIDRLGGHVANVYPGASLFHGPIYPTWLPNALMNYYPMDFNYVCLTGNEIDDNQLARILEISGLYMIDLTDTRVTDRSLQELQQYQGLRELSLRHVTTVTQLGIEEFKRVAPDCQILR